MRDDVRPAAWVRACGTAAIAAALPTVVWRVIVGLGPTLGTPPSWRRSEQLPGSGTGYVLGLSAVQLVAALLTLVLFVPGADRVPLTGRRLLRRLVLGTGGLGAVVLIALCVLSAVNWNRVDPFRDAGTDTAWTYLCRACYAAAPLWPVLLVATLVGYERTRATT